MAPGTQSRGGVRCPLYAAWVVGDQAPCAGAFQAQ